MTVLYVILLAVIQGITEFLPVSSFGHLCIIQNFLGMDHGPGVLLEAMLHFGTLAAVLFTFQKDIRHILYETLDILMDLVGNASLFIHNKRTGSHLRYARIVNTTYRKFTVLIWISMIPTVCIGYTARRLVALTAVSKLVPGAGMLITGIILLVIDLSRAGGKKTARDASYSNAMWIGICQGLSVFPGISRLGLTVCAALLCGYSRKFALLFSIFMSLPAVIGAFFTEIGYFGAASMTVGMIFASIFAMLLAGVAGCLVIRFMVQLVQKTKFRYFAVYSFAIGVIVLLCNYAF